jgi:hypothetical protein
MTIMIVMVFHILRVTSRHRAAYNKSLGHFVTSGSQHPPRYQHSCFIKRFVQYTVCMAASVLFRAIMLCVTAVSLCVRQDCPRVLLRGDSRWCGLARTGNDVTVRYPFCNFR